LVRQKVTPPCNVNTVGSNPAKISQLHMKNSTTYLSSKRQLEAAGESVFN